MDANITALAAIQGTSIFAALMPDLQEVRRANPTVHADFVADMRTAEFMSAGITISIALLVSILTRDKQPLIVGAIASASLITAYETVLYRVGN